MLWIHCVPETIDKRIKQYNCNCYERDNSINMLLSLIVEGNLSKILYKIKEIRDHDIMYRGNLLTHFIISCRFNYFLILIIF